MSTESDRGLRPHTPTDPELVAASISPVTTVRVLCEHGPDPPGRRIGTLETLTTRRISHQNANAIPKIPRLPRWRRAPGGNNGRANLPPLPPFKMGLLPRGLLLQHVLQPRRPVAPRTGRVNGNSSRGAVSRRAAALLGKGGGCPGGATPRRRGGGT